MLRVNSLLTAGLLVLLSLTSQSNVQAGGHHGNGGGGNRGGNSGGNSGGMNIGNRGGNFQVSRNQFSQPGNSNFRPQTVNFAQKNVVLQNNVSPQLMNRVVSKPGPISNGGHHVSNGNSSNGTKIFQGNQRQPNVNSNHSPGNGGGMMSHVKKLDGHFSNHGQNSSFLNKNGFQGPNFGQNGSQHMNGKHQFNSMKFNGGSQFFKASKSFGGCYPNNYSNKFCGTSPWKYCGYGSGCWGYGGYGCNFGGCGGYGYPTGSSFCGYNGYTCYYPSYGYGCCLYSPGCYGGISATIIQPCVTTAYQCSYAPVYTTAPLYSAVQTTDIPMEMALVNDSLPPLSDVILNESPDMIPPAPSATSSGTLELGMEDAKLVEAAKGARGPKY